MDHPTLEEMVTNLGSLSSLDDVACASNQITVQSRLIERRTVVIEATTSTKLGAHGLDDEGVDGQAIGSGRSGDFRVQLVGKSQVDRHEKASVIVVPIHMSERYQEPSDSFKGGNVVAVKVSRVGQPSDWSMLPVALMQQSAGCYWNPLGLDEASIATVPRQSRFWYHDNQRGLQASNAVAITVSRVWQPSAWNVSNVRNTEQSSGCYCNPNRTFGGAAPSRVSRRPPEPFPLTAGPRARTAKGVFRGAGYGRRYSDSRPAWLPEALQRLQEPQAPVSASLPQGEAPCTPERFSGGRA